MLFVTLMSPEWGLQKLFQGKLSHDLTAYLSAFYIVLE